MRTAIEFTHLLTGKSVVVIDPTTVAGILHGPVTNSKGIPEGPDHTWILLENIPNPIPVKETKDEVLVKLGLKEQNNE